MYIGLIVKASKLCNLRCTYCYETPELANRQRMAPESVEQMFTHIREFLKGWEKTSENHQLDFIWHGGEPFAQPISYWNAILRKQDKVFGASKNVAIVNNVQSNLTLLTEDHLPLLRHFRLGFS